MALTPYPNTFSLINNEINILKFWKENNIYDKLLQQNKDSPIIFRFTDGPPFVSSNNLHIGHLLVSSLKSSMLFFRQMKGDNVLNKTGYDCHGLPIEMVANNLLNVHTKDQIETFGIDNYNNKCKDIISSFSGDWLKVFDRIGRWIDITNEYKTMDTNFMESVWWAFKQLFDKGLIYNGYKIMPYSTGCCTALSNFEAGQNYKELIDVSIYVSFPIVNDTNISLIIWTTTPWTLPSNLALCVNPKITYVKIKDNKADKIYILAENCLKNIYANQKNAYTIIEKMTGNDLKGLKYIPIFNYFLDNDNQRLYQVLTDEFVNCDSGTGIVHLAPAFGEEDYNVCIKNNIIKNEQIGEYCPVDDSGLFTNKVSDFYKIYVLDANKPIIRMIRNNNRLVKEQQIKHSYPVCWRTDKPLIYKAVSSFFVKVTQIKDKLIENNNKMFWMPDFIRKGRFNNWLETVVDWNVSRSRFFGTPIPVWISDDKEEMVCIGSIDELVTLANLSERPTDLHREFVDNIQIPSKMGKGMLKSVKLTADCWFESGCVPFAQYHYPFENKNIFDNTETLSDFICEGVDQTRGWFYTLLVLSTALFDRPPSKNIICSGLVLDDTGNKISKRSGNYIPPEHIFEKYGADALRLYLIGSPAAHADGFKFVEEDMKLLFGRLYQIYNGSKFLVEHIIKFNKDGNTFDPNYYKNNNKTLMDRWILSRLGTLIIKINNYMNCLEIYKIINEIMAFDDDLRNWYIKYNRNNFRGRNNNIAEQHTALSTLFTIYYNTCLVLAPFCPFITESIYKKLSEIHENHPKSVHLNSYPEANDFVTDPIIERRMRNLQIISNMVNNLRSKTHTHTSVRFPLKKITIAHNDPEFLNDIAEMSKYLDEEVNALEIEYINQTGLISYKAILNNKTIGSTFREKASEIKANILSITLNDLEKFNNGQITSFTFGANIIDKTYFEVSAEFTKEFHEPFYAKMENNIIIIIDTEQTETIKELFIKRMFVVSVQKMRKATALHPWDPIEIYYESDNTEIIHSLTNNKNEIEEMLLYKIYPMPLLQRSVKKIIIEYDPNDTTSKLHSLVKEWSKVCNLPPRIVITHRD